MKRRIKSLSLLIPILLIVTACNMTIMLSAPIPFLESDPAPTREVVIQPTITATPSGYIGYITPKSNNTINVRGCASTRCDVVQSLRVGERLPVLVNEGGWYQIEIASQGDALALAWVKGDVVKFTSID